MWRRRRDFTFRHPLFPVRYTTRIIVPPRVKRSGMPGGPGTGPRPQAIGVRKSFGFGDRLGLAAAQVAVAGDHPDFAPFFAQHSPEGGPTPQVTLAGAIRAVTGARYRQPWGADADGLRTPQEVDETAAAGFTYFTVDLADHVRGDADEMAPDVLAAAVDAMVASGELPDDWAGPYLDRTVDLPGGAGWRLGIDALRRAAVKFAHAIHHGARMYETVARANRGRPFEIEISLAGIGSPVSTLEHLFLGLELEARGVRLTGLALRLDDGDPAAFDLALGEHFAVASFCGPYKLSFRSGTHDAALVPVIGRRCGDLLHYKTSGESYLEALRLASRLEPDLFHQLVVASDIAHQTWSGDLEAFYLDFAPNARHLDRTSSAVLAAAHDPAGCSLKSALLELLAQRADIYRELLAVRYERLMQDLNAG